MGRLEIIIGISFVYIVVTTLIGALSSRKQNKDAKSFMTAKNQMGPLLVGVLLMSEFIGTGSTLGTAQTAYQVGISAAWNLITLGLGFFLYAFLMAPKFNELGEHTISGALARRYGNGLRTIVSITMIYALITVNVSMFTGGAATIAKLLDIEITTSVLIIGAATVINVTFGGLRGIGMANSIHATFKYLGLFAVAWAAWVFLDKNPAAIANIPEKHFDMLGIGPSKLVAWTIANIGAVFSTQYVIQCISSLSTPAEAKKTGIIAGICIIPIGFLTAYIGVSSRGIFPDIKSVMAMPAFFDIMNPWAAGIAVSGIIAATFVTILACTIGASALIMKDIITPLLKPEESKMLAYSRIVTLIVGLLPIPFAMFVPGLLKTIFFARALRTAIAVLAVFMFYAPNVGSSKAATYGLVATVILSTVWFILGNPFGIDTIYIAAALPALIMVLDHLFSGKKSDNLEKNSPST